MKLALIDVNLLRQFYDRPDGMIEMDDEYVNIDDLKTNVNLDEFAAQLWQKFCDKRYASNNLVKDDFCAALKELLK